MKGIYISLPITGQEETYEARLNAAVEIVKEKYNDYKIFTHKDLVDNLISYYKNCYGSSPSYKSCIIECIEIIYSLCDTIFMCDGWVSDNICIAEHAFARAIDIHVDYQILHTQL